MRYLVLVLTLSVFGCATLKNGLTQQVPILVPDGTTVTDTAGRIIPINAAHERFPKTITLRRNKNYVLSFEYNGSRATVSMNKSMEAAWLLADIILYVLPTLVDLTTGGWYTFDGVRISFPDSTETAVPIIGSYTDDRELPEQSTKKIGVTALLGAGIAGPIGGDQAYMFIFGNSFTYGLGYKLTNEIQVFAEVNTNFAINVHPPGSSFTSTPRIEIYEASVRYSPIDDIYLGGGFGFSTIYTDSIKHHNDQGVDMVLPAAYAKMPIGSLAVGHAGSLGFIELQYRFGLHGFDLSSGERGNFSSWTLRYGFNIEF